MAKPVSGYLGYDTDADRPTVKLRSGTKTLLTEDDATVGSITDVDSADGSIAATNPGGPSVDLAVVNTPALRTTGSDVAVDAAAPPSAGQVLEATSATAAEWRSPRYASEIWVPPARKGRSADSRDVEFDSTTLGSWTLYEGTTARTFSSAAIDTTTNPAVNTGRYQLHTDNPHGDSWLRFQVAPSASTWLLTQPVTINSDDCVYTRLSTSYAAYSVGGPGNNSMQIFFGLWADDGTGKPDPANAITVGVDTDGPETSSFVSANRLLAGVSANIPRSQARNINSFRFPFQYFGIRKSSNDYICYAGTEGFALEFRSEAPIAFPTLAYWGFKIVHSNAGTDRFPSYATDFVRASTNMQTLPWW